MKEKTKARLEMELKSGNYSYEVKNPRDFMEFIRRKKVSDLFEIYLCEEFDNVDDFFATFTHKSGSDLEFYRFIMSHVDDFEISDKVLKENGFEKPEFLLHRDTVNAVSKAISTIYIPGEISEKQKFVDMAKSLTRKGKVLEVGSGVILPVTSLQFARDLGEVTSMDKFSDRWTSLDFFRKMKINPIEGYFTMDTPIGDYDTIVGQEACSAIIPIVNRLGNSDNQDYFLQVCDCGCPNQGSLYDFLNYLKSKDKRLKSVATKSEPGTNKIIYTTDGSPTHKIDRLFVTNSSMHQDDVLEKVSEICSR